MKLNDDCELKSPFTSFLVVSDAIIMVRPFKSSFIGVIVFYSLQEHVLDD